MKNIYLNLLLVLVSFGTFAGVNSSPTDSDGVHEKPSKKNTQSKLNPRPFITVWKTDNPGVTADNAIRIPAFGEYSYIWEELEDPSNRGTGRADGFTDITFP